MKDYYSFWKIKRPVFACQDIETDFFIAESQQGLVKRVTFFCQQGSPLIMVNAPDGHGKSTLARWLYDQLPIDTHEVLIVNLIEPPDSRGWLSDKLAQFFGTSGADASARAYAALDELVEEDKKLLVIVDNAQHLISQKALDEIASLMQLQSMTQNHVTFLLLSNTNLQSKMADHPIAHQINFSAEIPPLSLEECRDFLRFQLRNQNLQENLITDDSIFILHEISKGIYRQIATIAENCLMEAFISDDALIRPNAVIRAASYVVGQDEKSLRERFIPKQPTQDQNRVSSNGHSSGKLGNASEKLPATHATVKLRDLLYDDDVS